MSEGFVRPRDFAKGAPARVCGTEAEYDIQIPKETSTNTKDYELLREEVFARAGIRTDGDIGATIRWLTNGGNLHGDVKRVEYSSGEFNTPRGMAAGKFAGAILVGRITRTRAGARAYQHTGTTLNGSTRTLGHHDNYMFAASEPNRILPAMLDSFDASRVWGWSGRVGVNGFELSQKARGVGLPTSYSVGHRTEETKKPMGWIKLGDADVFAGAHAQGWARSERRLVDGGFSRVAAFMGAATGSMVLRIYEHRKALINRRNPSKNMPLRNLLFENPLQVLEAGSLDLTLKQTYRTADGKNLTLINMQERFGDYMDFIRSKIELSDEEHEGIDLLFAACDRLRKVNPADPESDLKPIMGWVDFAPHLAYLRHKHPGVPLTSENNKVIQSSFMWNLIEPAGPGASYWEHLYKTGQAPDPVGDKLIAHHVDYPSDGTRSAIRGEAVRIESLRKRLAKINWNALALDDQDTTQYIALHPYQNDVSILYQ